PATRAEVRQSEARGAVEDRYDAAPISAAFPQRRSQYTDPVMGRMLIATGVVLIVAGLLVTFAGRLPGDIEIRGKNSAFYFPVVTCLVVSVLLSLAMWLLGRR
ncbi:MAG: DUF2905 domain-containing protein, partial [Bryobacteraceae bacterium]